MNKEEIIKILNSHVGCAYCHNCQNKDNDNICDYCNRKSFNWELSENTAENIANEIINLL